MAEGKYLKVFYYDGKPDGIRWIKRELSPITAYVVPRALYSQAKKVKGIDRPGVYFLLAENEDGVVSKMYIGQTELGISRLDDHNKKKDWWNKAILFLADKDTFNKSIIVDIENYAIKMANDSQKYTLDNAAIPQGEIDEFQMTTVKEAYNEILFIMGTQGYSLEDNTTSSNDIYHTTRNGITARAVYGSDLFVVLAGSEIDMDRTVITSSYNDKRKDLQNQGYIVLENGKYILKKDLEFRTPSGASDFVLGGSTNGWVEWKNQHGETLDKVIRQS